MTRLTSKSARPKPGRWLGPGPTLLRVGRATRRGDGATVLKALARGHDDAVGLRFRGRRVLLLLDPELVGRLLVEHAALTTKGPGVQMTRPLLGEGLLASEGDAHRRARRLVAAAFSPRRLAGYVAQFGERAVAAITDWPDGDVVDIHSEMGALTLDIVGRTLLGVDLRADTGGIRSAIEASLLEFDGGLDQSFGKGERAASVGRRSERTQAAHQVVDTIIDERREHPNDDRGDVVSALLAASDDDGLSCVEVHDHVMTLLMAGHETTANALTWTLHLLSHNPASQRRLQQEVDGLGGRAPTFDQLPALRYTRAVVSEGLRIYPPAWVIGRTLATDLDFGRWGAPSGTVVAASPLLLQHDPRWFDQPEKFDPQRWLDGRQERLPRYAFLPFGAGPRACIGERFAWAEAITVLAVVSGAWTVRPVGGPTVATRYAVTMRPAHGLPLRLERR